MLVSHDPQAAAYADRVYALRDGKLGDYEPDSRLVRRRRVSELAREKPPMKPRNILHLYRVRLRARLLQECFAIVGHRRRGRAAVRLAGREPEPVQLGGAALARDRRQRDAAADRARSAAASKPGCSGGCARLQACAPPRRCWKRAPTRSARAAASRSSSSAPIRACRNSGGSLVRHTSLSSFAGIEAVVLPAPLAHKMGVTKFGQEATFQLNGRVAEAALYEQLHAKQIGPLIVEARSPSPRSRRPRK